MIASVQDRPRPACRIRRIALGCLLLIAAGGDTSVEAETRLSVRASNDALSGTDLSDDLYTAALVVGGQTGRWSFTLGEYMFTDRTADLRFDETFALTSVRLPATGRWAVTATVGAMRTGRGLLGQNAQNEAHKLTGDAPVDLDYVADDEMYAAAGLHVAYPLALGERLRLELRIDLFSADGFRRHAVAAVDVRLRVRPRTTLLFTTGLRDGDTDYAPLEPHLADTEPVVEIGVLHRGFLSAAWSHNRYGTGESHLHLGGRWTWPRPADPAGGISASGSTFYP